jgi:hypothetical protein
MSTIGYDSWAVDLADVGAVYPFQGAEFIMVIIAVALWIGFHIWQIRSENEDIAYDVKHADLKKHIEDEVEKY